MTILSASRIGVVFSPSLESSQTPPVKATQDAYTPVKRLVPPSRVRKDVREEMPRPMDESQQQTSTTTEPVQPTRSKRQLMPTETSDGLRLIYESEIQTCRATGKKPKREAVRKHLELVKERYPHLTELQVPDKIWTLSQQKEPAEAPSGSQPAKAKPANKGRVRTALPEGLKGELIRIFNEELEISVATGKKVKLFDIRLWMHLVTCSFPHLKEQQVRDKIWNIARRLRKERDLE